MPTNRTRISRGRRKTPRVTDAAVDLYATVKRLKPLYYACLFSKTRHTGFACKSTQRGLYCLDWAAYSEARQKLELLLGTHPWEAGVTEVTGPDPPERLDKPDRIAWRRAWSTRQVLEAAVEKKRKLIADSIADGGTIPQSFTEVCRTPVILSGAAGAEEVSFELESRGGHGSTLQPDHWTAAVLAS
jgi:hypothetical protein